MSLDENIKWYARLDAELEKLERVDVVILYDRESIEYHDYLYAELYVEPLPVKVKEYLKGKVLWYTPAFGSDSHYDAVKGMTVRKASYYTCKKIQAILDHLHESVTYYRDGGSHTTDINNDEEINYHNDYYYIVTSDDWDNARTYYFTSYGYENNVETIVKVITEKRNEMVMYDFEVENIDSDTPTIIAYDAYKDGKTWTGMVDIKACCLCDDSEESKMTTTVDGKSADAIKKYITNRLENIAMRSSSAFPCYDGATYAYSDDCDINEIREKLTEAVPKWTFSITN